MALKNNVKKIHKKGNEDNKSITGPVVQKVDNAIHQINSYPLDSPIGFSVTYPLDSDLSSRYHHPPFEQMGPDKLKYFKYTHI